MSTHRSLALLRESLILLGVLGVLAIGGYGFARLVDKGRPKRQQMSRELEIALANTVEASIRLGNEVVETPAINDLTKELQGRLEAGLTYVDLEKEAPEEIRVLVVYSSMVNALAFPGNLVILYSGLIHAMDGPEELAGVLAHEIGHCVNHDARNALIQEIGLSVLLGAAGAGSAGELADDVIRGALRLQYGRKAENRADEFAVDLLAASGLDPKAYASALKSLRNSSKEIPEWFRYTDVHAPIDRRINEAQGRAQQAAEAFPVAWQPLDVDWNAAIASLPSRFEVPEE